MCFTEQVSQKWQEMSLINLSLKDLETNLVSLYWSSKFNVLSYLTSRLGLESLSPKNFFPLVLHFWARICDLWIPNDVSKIMLAYVGIWSAFDSVHKSRKLYVSNFNQTLTYKSLIHQWSVARMTEWIFDQQIRSLTLRIDDKKNLDGTDNANESASILLGVVTPAFDTYDGVKLGDCANSWGVTDKDGDIGHNGLWQRKQIGDCSDSYRCFLGGDMMCKGDILRIIVDMVKKQVIISNIEQIHDGSKTYSSKIHIHYTINITNITPPVAPAIAMRCQSQISVLSYGLVFEDPMFQNL